MALDLSMLEAMGLEEILLWLLSFAVVFGILSQVGETGLPKSKGTRGIIAIVLAFFVLFAAAGTGLTDVLSSMSVGLLLIIIAVIVFVIFLETAGVKVSEFETKEGVTVRKKEKGNIIREHPIAFAIALIAIAVFVFIAAGGMSLIGFDVTIGTTSSISLLFFGVLILAIIWLIANPD